MYNLITNVLSRGGVLFYMKNADLSVCQKQVKNHLAKSLGKYNIPLLAARHTGYISSFSYLASDNMYSHYNKGLVINYSL